jgi:predicted metalloprotease
MLLAVLMVALIGAVGAAAVTARRHTRPAEVVALSERPGDLGKVTDATRASLEEFWSAQLPATYHRPFRTLAGGYQPKTPQSPPFTCAGQRQTYRDIRGNAFYCPADDYIAWDAALLFPQLDRRFGSVTPAIVLAHEMGHAVQNRVGVQAASVVVELQADCLAGSWIRYAESSDADPVAVVGHGLDSAVAAILVLRDQPGTPAVNPQAHGLGFDRVNAFQSGYEQGTAACAAFPSTGVITTELPFETYQELLTNGNSPYDEALPFVGASLDQFWTGGFPVVAPAATFARPARRPVPAPPLPPCPTPNAYDVRAVAGYCPTDNTVTWADSLLRQLHQAGDMVTGTVLSEMWGRAAQTQAHLPTQGVPAGLQRDCFTGAWVANLASSRGALLRLSPGDLDEVLVTIVATSYDASGAPAARGGAFERTDALRKGLLAGLAACR